MDTATHLHWMNAIKSIEYDSQSKHKIPKHYFDLKLERSNLVFVAIEWLKRVDIRIFSTNKRTIISMGVDLNGFYIFCIEIMYALVKDTDASKSRSINRFHVSTSL